MSSYLQWIKEVEDDLEEGTENHSEEEDNKQNTDGLQQNLMSWNDVKTWDRKSH